MMMSAMSKISNGQPTGAPLPPPEPRANDPLDLMLRLLNATEAKIKTLRQFLADLETERHEIKQVYEAELRARTSADKDRMSNRDSDRDHSEDAIMHDPHHRDRDHESMAEIPLVPDPGTDPGGQGLLPQHPVATSRTQQPLPQPPTHPFAGVALPAYPCGEGRIWFNPAPKVKQVDVKLVHTLQIVTDVVKFSRDGEWVALGRNKTAYIYNVKTGSETCVLDHPAEAGHPLYFRTLCFSPDGKYLATGALDKRIRIWDIAKTQICNTFEGHQEEIHSLDFSSDGRFIVSASRDQRVHIWDVHDGTFKVLTNDDHYSLYRGASVIPVSISPDGRYVAVGGSNAFVSIWEMSTGMLVQRLRGHRGSVNCVTFMPDGKGLVSGSADRVLKHWDVSRLGIESAAENGLVGTQREGKGKKKAVGPDSPAITSTSSSSNPIQYTSRISSDALSPCIMNVTGHNHIINSVAVSHDGAWLVSGSKDYTALFWDARTGVVQCMLLEHKIDVVSVDFSPAGNFLATVGGHKTRIWSYSVRS